jgi:hypothetical protein
MEAVKQMPLMSSKRLAFTPSRHRVSATYWARGEAAQSFYGK